MNEEWKTLGEEGVFAEVLRQAAGSLYEDTGGDPNRCEICDRPLDGTDPWQRGLDGAGAHTACLRRLA